MSLYNHIPINFKQAELIERDDLHSMKLCLNLWRDISSRPNWLILPTCILALSVLTDYFNFFKFTSECEMQGHQKSPDVLVFMFN